MSRATELARAEAEEAEQENPDAEPVEPIEPDEGEQEAEAEEDTPEPEPSSLAQVENIDKALEQESKRHAKALAKALGDQWEHFEMCPLCQVDGYAMAYQPGEISPEQREAIMTVMGENGAPDYKQHPTEVRCPECDGWGEMLNGSRRPEQSTSACQKCMGTGHTAKEIAPNVSHLPPPPSYPWQEQEQTAPVQTFGDEWGRPTGHPDYGIHPAQIVASRQTA